MVTSAVINKANVSKVKKMVGVDVDGRYSQTCRNIFIGVEVYLEVRNISARWILHRLTDSLKRLRVNFARHLLKMYIILFIFNCRQFAKTMNGC